MAGLKEFYFHPNTLLRLLTHYTDGVVPMRGEAKEMVASQILQRMIGIVVESDEWETDEPLHIRYDGKRIASWTKDGKDRDNKDNHMVYQEKNETPKWQN